ncbi:MAG: xanthine dehydrogenase small subunit [Proteobacteria bacterium]|nr:xanthine dehydrogenase small subunit [Pseudomonadota bacterium]
MSGRISFLLNGEPRSIGDVAPTTTVLEYLRGAERACGTKEGCAEGDCGACTVVLGEPAGDSIRYRAINGCIALLPQIDGKLLLTVEGLADGAALHPVQDAMVAADASQCGFCTPGFVMALFAFQHGGEAAHADAVHEALAGNLCRCTGYRPIVAAAERIAGTADQKFAALEPTLGAALAALPRDDLALAHGADRFFAPTSLELLLALRAAYPEAHLLAGGTDLALLVTKEYRALERVIAVTRVPELQRVVSDDTTLTVGAAVTYTDALLAIERHWPSLGLMIRRLGSRQIRNVGTIGGNLANASPIGDMPPALIALGAAVTLRSLTGARELALEDFFIDYRRTALRPDEIVEAVRIPLPRAAELFRTDKVSKRWDQDISAVCGAYRITRAGDRVTDARIAFGGMAATPRRAPLCERALIGRPWAEATIEAAVAALDQDFLPIGDWRASADYRRRVAGNLLRRLWLETARPDIPLAVMAL